MQKHEQAQQRVKSDLPLLSNSNPIITQFTINKVTVCVRLKQSDISLSFSGSTSISRYLNITTSNIPDY